MEASIDLLVETWQKIALPKYLQMDNGLEFRGSNAYPRSLSRLMRVCLDVQVHPVFIPPREPWRNGVIENLNGLIQCLFLKAKTFKNEKQLFKEAQQLETCINTTHRLPALDGKTPNEFAAKASFLVFRRQLAQAQSSMGKGQSDFYSFGSQQRTYYTDRRR